MAEESEERIVSSPGIPFDPVKKDWEDEITDAYRDPTRKAVWIPMSHRTGNWYLTRERGIHDLANAALRAYIEAEIARRQDQAEPE